MNSRHTALRRAVNARRQLADPSSGPLTDPRTCARARSGTPNALPPVMNTTNLPKATRSDCSHQYGGENGQTGLAHTTTAYFVFAGIVHRVVRFWRHDYLRTGKIEIYTLEPFAGEYTSSTELGWVTFACGDFFRYADEANPSKVDLLAMQAIAAADPTYSSAHLNQAARYAAMEMA